jgi:ectoine hydroxylase-related dioxygenase (phytanoyl-CoA dioxygenase family)
MSTQAAVQDYPLTQEQIAQYRRDGFIKLDHVFEGEELAKLRSAVETAVAAENTDKRNHEEKGSYEQIFIQKVNLWQRHPAVREFALSSRLANIAARLEGVPMRMWHDQALFKEPRTGARTPWHQDAHYWPHEQKNHPTTIWIALKDATLDNGCMSFIPGTQDLTDLQSVNLGNPQSVQEIAPQLKGKKGVPSPIPAGSCTFHHGLTFHYAGPNKSDSMREAFAIIYMADGTTFSGSPHLVTGPLKLEKGAKLEGETFPLLSTRTV